MHPAAFRPAPVLVAALVAGAWLQAAPQDPPVFRSRIDLISVDVSVVGREGTPIDGLGAERFTVRIDGLPRRVARAVYVPDRTATLAPVSSPDVSTNEHVDSGRVVLLAVDQRHIRRVEGLAALRGAASFIDQLDPSDRVGAATLDHIGPIQFTNEHAAVKSYLQTLAGTASSLRGQYNIGIAEALAIGDGNRTWLDRAVLRECGEPLSRFESMARIAEAGGLRDPCPVQVEQESRALAQEIRADGRTALNHLMGLIARLADIDGPKTMVLVSEGLIAEPQLIDLTSLGAAAQAARVTIYVLQLEVPAFDASESTVSPTAIQDRQLRAEGLARLAGAARGAHFHLVGADPYPFGRILRELSAYYLVAFEALPADLDGRTRRVSVSVDAPGATVRARPSFRRDTVASDTGEAQIVRLLRAPRLATELPLHLTSHVLREPDGRLRVVISAEAAAVDGGAVTFGYVAVDGRGVVAASGRQTAIDGRLTQAVAVAHGQYTVKVAAIDATGRTGSVERRVDARLIGRGVAGVSDLVLTDTAPGEPLRPIVGRAAGTRLAAVLEVYGAPGWRPDQMSVLVKLNRAGDDAAPAAIPATLTRVTASSWRARADLPARLPEGSYLAVAEIALPDGMALKVERSFVR